jgi:hypothetical protein
MPSPEPQPRPFWKALLLAAVAAGMFYLLAGWLIPALLFGTLSTIFTHSHEAAPPVPPRSVLVFTTVGRLGTVFVFVVFLLRWVVNYLRGTKAP